MRHLHIKTSSVSASSASISKHCSSLKKCRGEDKGKCNQDLYAIQCTEANYHQTYSPISLFRAAKCCSVLALCCTTTATLFSVGFFKDVEPNTNSSSMCIHPYIHTTFDLCAKFQPRRAKTVDAKGEMFAERPTK